MVRGQDAILCPDVYNYIQYTAVGVWGIRARTFTATHARSISNRENVWYIILTAGAGDCQTGRRISSQFICQQAIITNNLDSDTLLSHPRRRALTMKTNIAHQQFCYMGESRMLMLNLTFKMLTDLNRNKMRFEI